MSDQTDADTALPVTSARNGGEHSAAGEMRTAGYTRVSWPEALPSPDLRPPCGDQEADASDAGPGADALVAPGPVHRGRSW